MTSSAASRTRRPTHDDEQHRSLNRSTVQQYFRAEPEHRRRRHELYTDDGAAGLWFTDFGAPIVVRGQADLRRHGELSLQVLPDWHWYDIELIETLDPTVFWVECSGQGTINFPGYPQGWYRNAFLHSFRLRAGLIEVSREFSNPVEQMRALSMEVPVIARDWIPADTSA